MEIYRAVADVPPARIWDGVLARVVNGERVTVGFVDLDPNVQVPEPAPTGIWVQGSM